MYIKIRIKTKRELTKEFPRWRASSVAFKSDEWAMKRLGGYAGQEITQLLSKLYSNFEEVPIKIILHGYELHKRYLDWQPLEKSPCHVIANGLQKLGL